MKILLTNDDGVMAPGIAALHEAVRDFGEVAVVAPRETQSAISHAITVQSPILVERVRVNGAFDAWSVDGRPADCVKLAMHELLDWRPDFVISGINAGANTGVNVLYSGTVAGALESVFFGVPSMALSLELTDEPDFQRAGKIAGLLFRRFVEVRPADSMCLSVNIPAMEGRWPCGVRVCGQASHRMEEHYAKDVDSSGRTYFRLDGRLPDKTDDPDTDLAAMLAGYVTVTPLRYEMTDRSLLSTVGRWGWPTDFA